MAMIKLPSCCIQFAQRLLVIFTLSLLSACVTVNQTTPVDDIDKTWLTRTGYLYEHPYWTAKMSLLGVTEEQKFKTKVIWQQQGDRYQIKLQDFIGRTVAIIDGSEASVVVKTSKGQRYQGDDAETLIQELFDMQIPVSGLRYWLQGVPQPDSQLDELKLSAEGLAESMHQHGWQMSYPYYLANDPFKMPSQVKLAIDDLSLTVKISQWDFSE